MLNVRTTTNNKQGQYREMGVLLWRGFTYDDVMAQCFGNCEDTSTKGKQMPVVRLPRASSIEVRSSRLHVTSLSTLARGSTTSILSHHHWRRKSHKLQV